MALILKNKNIRFNNLINVDDPEEAESKDMGKIGKHCLISCWTNNSEDVLPMWNMYTPDMKGVRIKMKVNPFKEYTYEKDEFFFKEKTKSFINYNSDYAKIVSITADNPRLVKVEYTNDENLLIPEVRSYTKIRNESNTTISFENVGKYKRKYWEFQAEYRYIICTAPWSMSELESVKTIEEQNILINRFYDETTTQFCNEIFLELAPDAFDGMEILLAPKTLDEEYIIVEALLEKYCKENTIKLTKSKIKIR